MFRARGIALRNARQDEDYLLHDDFSGTIAGGSLNNTWSTSGRGIRGVLDGNSKLSIGSGVLSAATGGVANFDPSLVYQDTFARVPGMMMKVIFTLTSGRGMFGWLNNPALVAATINGARRGCFDFNSTTLAVAPSTTGSINVGTISLTQAYTCTLIQRNIGMFYFIKGGAFTNQTLLYMDEVGTSPLLNPFFSALSTTGVFTADLIYIPRQRYLPSPLASDGFGLTFGTSDGFGHAAGVHGGLGTGGGSLTYTQVGTWANSGGVANASALSGGSAIAYVASGKADVIATVKLTRSGGDGGLLLRFVDGNNFVTCRHDGTNVILVKKVAGSNTTVQTTAATYAAGAELRVVAEGTKFRIFYNGALVGSEQTISDAALQSPANHGLYTTNTGNTFDDLNIYARGSGGEYAALDAF